MEIFVCEFVSGGGLSSEYVSSSLFSEAFAMLRVLLSSFASGGDHTITLIDKRIAPIAESLPGQTLFVKSETAFYENLQRYATKADLIICVAPETDGCLSHCSHLLETAAPGKLLGCSEEFIQLSGNKWQTATCWNSLGLATPETYRVTFDKARAFLQEKAGSYVVKPLDGVSGDGIVLLSTPEDLENISQHLSYLMDGDFLLQEFKKGLHGSFSFICGDMPFLLSSNRQLIKIHDQTGFFEYQGGETPWKHPQVPLISEKAKKFLKQSSGAHGWVGIDFVVNSGKSWLIECNPRMTSSVVGAWTLDSEAISANLKAARNLGSYRSLPSGYSVFKKVTCRGTESWDETLRLMERPGVASPPFPFQERACAFLTAKGKSRTEAQREILSLESDLQALSFHERN
ncbi:MAG: ATP-grasp domain-containing protein [Candidatus Hodarchaeota archaeon]